MIRILMSAVLLTLFAASTWAVAPTPEAYEKWRAEGVLDQKIANWTAFKNRGGCAPNEVSVFKKDRVLDRMATDAMATDTINVVVIMVEFSDNLMATGQPGTPEIFDSILFSDGAVGPIVNPTGSMTDYYMETSYGQFYVKGDIYGPYTPAGTYAYYVSDDDGLSRSDDLVAELVDLADADIDYSLYARDDINCDGLIIIHAGRGAEEGADPAIWSHKFHIPSPVQRDGVTIYNYTMNPEESGTALSPIGVFCHEYGHFLGLPDLYDINYNPGSNGLGNWSLMANGNYLGGSKKPAHFDAWCKSEIGFLTLVDVTENLSQAELPASEFNPVAYRLRNPTSGSNEYWVVENRQKSSFDTYLPNSGLCIYHVDNTLGSGGSNVQPPYRVALEQADGNFDLEITDNNDGDGGDTWPGAVNNRAFHDYSSPTSALNDASLSHIAVWDISASDSVMYADLDIERSRPLVQLVGGTPVQFNDDPPRGDGDGVPEAGETIHVYASVANLLRTGYNPRLTLATSNPGVTFTVPTVTLPSALGALTQSNPTPMEFVVADSVTPVIDSFFVTVTTDSLDGVTGTNEWSAVFGIEQQVGASQVLIVDDDRGDDRELKYQEAFYAIRVPVRTWSVQISGTPQLSDLAGYNMVFWHTSKDAGETVLDAGKMAVMKSYLDGGGNLFLSTLGGIADINATDPTLLTNYFRASVVATDFFFQFVGLDGSQVGQDTKYRFNNDFGTPQISYFEALSGGESAFRSDKPGASDQIWGVTHNSGTYKTVLLSVPAEYINNGLIVSGFASIDTLLIRTMNYFGGIATAVYDGSSFGALPQSFELGQNFPNPFNPTTVIRYTLRSTGGAGEKPARTRLTIYNALGREVKTLVDATQIPGTYEVEWSGSADDGHKVASGIYFYRLERGDESQSMKMVLLK